MKNERIITHFQSYTTAKGCVKDLTPYFKERISILTPKHAQNPATTGGVDNRTEIERLADGGMGAAETLMAEMAEIGGIALGTIAYLYPGMSPILTGGPIAGDAIGQSVGSYMLAEMGEFEQAYGLEDGPGGTRLRGEAQEESTNHTNNEKTGTSSANRSGSESVFIAVDVYSEQEAMTAERIIMQYGGKPHRGTSRDADGEFPSYESLPANHGVESPYSFGNVAPSNLPPEYRNPATEGYDLEPIAPFSPQGWIDPNIGLGDTNLVDPQATAGLPPKE
ncbi:hypothetical protein JJB07_15520 [Tumebacillus sp. ITR2]|uniref:Uncharacterized protein n=1 Tax=Tumebacillus amylolyticus TaxID=2801339 RepID=A0ABS1JCM7_9BACL|nr:hypothetical protein [Tumebacillus amylolyticus]MBL0388027.1 hypothetical protein [Tumebacillus amylolyticus]